ncbi:MAG: ribosome biogenesis factor YjgA [Burkholderiales bacterium]
MENETAISKTRRKREMHALQSLGEELVHLSPEQLAAIDLPEGLRDAVLEARRITQRGARRRQLQYLGRLMREVDAAHVRERLGALRSAPARQTARFHQCERWRARMLEAPEALAEFLALHPSADKDRLHTLVSHARREAQERSLQGSARALFQAILQAIGEPDEKHGA